MESKFSFTNRSKGRIKCLYYDGTGTWLFYKVLNSGHFDWRITGDGIVSITSQQLNWLLDGLNMETGKVYKKTTPCSSDLTILHILSI
ncbi:IS66 family insertion sequence element accessory protein TnpB [Allobaculum sp. Allo2]|uniref:IS66 family insertion sequence element accessory protein TnpB n=1 Tax=Allobaculum sp. Allo2 TaxID=2853432 RepID=UPI001F600858|nr:IS66 family insertion sequence element accessory protein TnpB [Allobaculum sp. Allo2]UNT92589.1 IS66 family insertion sequence element accessory protein TnpB [Allobaculum sp. Allo2]